MTTPVKKAEATPPVKRAETKPENKTEETTETEATEATEPKVETELVERGFVYEHGLDQSRNIPGTNEYLDEKQRREAEIVRARVEDRKPDLKNPPSTQGTPLVATSIIEAQVPHDVKVEPDVTLKVSIVKEEK